MQWYGSSKPLKFLPVASIFFSASEKGSVTQRDLAYELFLVCPQELQAEKEESDRAAEEMAQRLGDVQQQHAEEIDQLQRQMRVR